MKKIDRKLKFVSLAILLTVLTQAVFAGGITKVGTAAATFLRIPVGSRAVGMGSSFVSMMNDPSALYWNPSIMSSIKSNALLVEHSNWLPGIDFEFVGVILPFDQMGTIGISATILHTDDMEVTTPTSPMGTGEIFSASSFALGFSYSKYLTDKFSIGGTVKYVRETIYNSIASGVSFDVGTIYETPFAGIRLGASISNFGTKMKMSGEDLNIRVDIAPTQEGNNQSIVGKLNTDEFDMPLIMRIGISGEVFNSENFRWTLSADGVNPNDNAQSVNLGSELAFLNDLVSFRVGYRDLFLKENETGLAFGVSVNNIKILGDFSVSTEYSYQNFVHLGNSNRFSLIIKF